MLEPIKHCNQCGTAVEQRIPATDSRERAVCPACGHIHYSNPKIVAGCLFSLGDKILLCQRDIEPRIGYWTLPAGYMENGESTEEGAAREAREEAHARSKKLRLFALYDLPRINHVYMLFHGELLDGHAAAGEETRAVGLFSEDDIPRDRLAFTVMSEALDRYFDDRRAGIEQIHRASFYGKPGSFVEVIRQ